MATDNVGFVQFPDITSADAKANAAASAVDVRQSVFNGTTFDRTRSAQGAAATGLGVLASAAIPVNLDAASTSAANSTALVASLVVKATAGTLYGIAGYNANAAARFIQIHDATALPANTSVPEVVVNVGIAGNFNINFGPFGRRFATGIVVANSTTAPTLTVGTADSWISAEYV